MDEVVTAVNALFFGDAGAQKRANEYLMRLPEHADIWTKPTAAPVVLHLLHHEQFHVQFVGAQLLYNKVRFHFDAAFAEGITGSVAALTHGTPLPHAVHDKLCAILAALAAHQVLSLQDVLRFEPRVALQVLEYVPDELHYRKSMVDVGNTNVMCNMDTHALVQFLRQGADPVVPQCLTVFVNWARLADLRFLNDPEIARDLIKQMSDPQVVDCITEGLMRSPQAQGLGAPFYTPRGAAATAEGPEGDCLDAIIEYLRTPAFDSHAWVQALSMVCNCYLQVVFVHQHILYAVGALFQHNAKMSMTLVEFFSQIADLKNQGFFGVDELRFILPVITAPCVNGMLRFLTPGEMNEDDAEDYEHCARSIVFKLLTTWKHLDRGEYILSLLDPTTIAGLQLLEGCADAFGEELPQSMIQKIAVIPHLRDEVAPYMAKLIGSCARHLASHPDIISVVAQYLFNQLKFPECALAFRELASSVGHLLPRTCIEPFVTRVEAARLPVASDAACFATAMCIARSRATLDDIEFVLEKCYNFEQAAVTKRDNVPHILFRLFKRIEMCLSELDFVAIQESVTMRRRVSTAICTACDRDCFADGCVYALGHANRLAEVAGKVVQQTIRHLKDASAEVQATCGTCFSRMTRHLPLKWALLFTKECIQTENASQDISMVRARTNVVDTPVGATASEDTLAALRGLIKIMPNFATSRWSEMASGLALRVLAECCGPDLIVSALEFLANAMRETRGNSDEHVLQLSVVITQAALENFHKWDDRCDEVLIPLLEALADLSTAPFASFLQAEGPVQSQLDPERREVCLRCFQKLRSCQLALFMKDLRCIARKEKSADALLACEMMVPAG
eukprot:GEMP01008449.1.p1 GENE.GEMP01008449.1~~GEMP01008449.1.p1  ORF type:complete len:851 (+),score=194.47 GEMP01008449.1:34-2586(+)